MAQAPVYFESVPVKGEIIAVPVMNKYGADVLVQVTVGDEIERIGRYVNKGRDLDRGQAFRATVNPLDRERATADDVIIEVIAVAVENPDDRRKKLIYAVRG